VEILDPALEGVAERIGVEESYHAGYRRGGPVRVRVRAEVRPPPRYARPVRFARRRPPP
jgi:hypothetical protein